MLDSSVFLINKIKYSQFVKHFKKLLHRLQKGQIPTISSSTRLNNNQRLCKNNLLCLGECVLSKEEKSFNSIAQTNIVIVSVKKLEKGHIATPSFYDSSIYQNVKSNKNEFLLSHFN